MTQPFPQAGDLVQMTPLAEGQPPNPAPTGAKHDARIRPTGWRPHRSTAHSSFKSSAGCHHRSQLVLVCAGHKVNHQLRKDRMASKRSHGELVFALELAAAGPARGRARPTPSPRGRSMTREYKPTLGHLIEPRACQEACMHTVTRIGLHSVQIQGTRTKKFYDLTEWEFRHPRRGAPVARPKRSRRNSAMATLSQSDPLWREKKGHSHTHAGPRWPISPHARGKA
jgi:hypothetical protein